MILKNHLVLHTRRDTLVRALDVCKVFQNRIGEPRDGELLVKGFAHRLRLGHKNAQLVTRLIQRNRPDSRRRRGRAWFGTDEAGAGVLGRPAAGPGPRRPGIGLEDLAREFQIFFTGVPDLWVQHELDDARFRVQERYGLLLRLLALGDAAEDARLMKDLRRSRRMLHQEPPA